MVVSIKKVLTIPYMHSIVFKARVGQTKEKIHHNQYLG